MNNFLKNNWPKLTAFQLARIDFLYPKAEQFPDRGPYFRTAANAYGDLRYTCPGLYLSSKFGDDGVQNIYNYRWDVLTEANALNGDGVTHTAGVAPTWGLYLPGLQRRISVPTSSLISPVSLGHREIPICTG